MAAAQKSNKEEYRNVQLWISDLQKLFRPNEEDYYHCQESKFKTLCVVGTVVNAIVPWDWKESNKPVKYTLDDGTGVLSVVQFVQNRMEWLKKNDITKYDASKVEQLGSLAKKNVDMLKEFDRGSFPIGTCVEAKGKLQNFRGEVQLLAFSVRKLPSAQAEVDRMILTSSLKKNGVYDDGWPI